MKGPYLPHGVDTLSARQPVTGSKIASHTIEIIINKDGSMGLSNLSPEFSEIDTWELLTFVPVNNFQAAVTVKDFSGQISFHRYKLE